MTAETALALSRYILTDVTLQWHGGNDNMYMGYVLI